MTAAGYLLVGVFVLGPLAGAVAASARGRSHPLWLALLWLAVLGSGAAFMALVVGRWNLHQESELATVVMACGIAAWVALVIALAFPRRRPRPLGADPSNAEPPVAH